MSLFPSTLTGRVLDDGQTPPPVIELQGISAGQLSLVLTQYTPLETTTQNTADIGTNAAAIAALQGQVAALPAAPDLTPYALAADLAAAEGSILANASGLVAVNTSLTQGLATKANQSALDALQVEVNGKSTPASVDLKLNHPTTAAMNSSIASANNATLSSVAATYALKTVVDQLAIDLAARQTAADVDQRVATALLSYLTQTAYQAGQALQDARLDGHDAEILALQNAGPITSREPKSPPPSWRPSTSPRASLDRDVTVAAASTLNATTADITQLTVGSTAATGAFSSNSSGTANLEVVSNLRLEAPLVRCDPTAPWLSIEGGAQGVLVNDTLRVNGAIAPEASLPYLFLSGGTTGLEMNTKFAAVTGLGDPGGFCELAVINQAATGWRASSSPRRTARPRGAGASWWRWPTAACSSTP